MTYDDRAILAEFHAAQNLGYPLLQDEDVKHMTAYSVRNEEYEAGDQGYGIPDPGILYIRKDGTIAGKFAVPGYRGRPPFEEVHEFVSATINGGP